MFNKLKHNQNFYFNSINLKLEKSLYKDLHKIKNKI